MDKEEATEIANQLLSRYANPLPLEEELASFTGILMVYGRPVGGTIFSKEAALDLLRKINERSENTTVKISNIRYTVKRAWLEETGESGCIKAEYVKEDL